MQNIKYFFIKGIFIRDFRELLEDESDTEEPMPESHAVISVAHSDINYKKLPNSFINLEEWPKTCNLLCWQCSLPFESVPIFIPKSIEPITRKEKGKCFMSVYGVFCSYYHAIEFILTRSFNTFEKTEMINRVKYLYYVMNKKKYIDPILEKPSVYDMKPYGGNLSQHAYAKIIQKL